MEQSANYHMGVGQHGISRRKVMNQLTNPTTMRFLLEGGLKPGMKVLDLGCGIGIMSCWISEVVGSKGQVTGIDSNAEQLAIAKEIAVEENITNIEYKQFSVDEIAKLKGEYDFIYCRFLLVHLQDPQQLIKQIFKLLKPGGIFACQSAIYGREFCYPASSAFNCWRDLRHDVFVKLNKDPQTGSKVPGFMREAGFVGLQSQLFQPVLDDIDIRNEMIVNDLIEQESQLLKYKLIDENEIVQLKEELIELIAEPKNFMAYHQSAQVVGTKPE